MILQGYASISHEESGSLINYFDEYIYFTEYKTKINTSNELDYIFEIPSDFIFATMIPVTLPEIKIENVIFPAKALLESYTIQLAEIETIYNNALTTINNAIGDAPDTTNITTSNELQVEWTSISLSQYTKDISNGLTIAHDAIDKVKKTLETINSLIQGVRGLLQIIKQSLAVWEDIGKQFIQYFAEQIEKFFKDIRSTGIYMLDMTTYHFMDNDDDPIKYESHIGPWWWSSSEMKKTDIFAGSTLKSITKGTWKDVSKAYSDLDKRVNGIVDENGNIVDIDNINPPYGNQIATELLQESFSYKRESYNEFIEKICFHFTNPKDILPTQLKKENKPFAVYLGNNGVGSIQGHSVFKDATVKGQAENVWAYSPFGIFDKSSGGIKNLRTGTPDFGENGNLKVVIIAMAMPDVTQIIKIIWTLFGYQKGSDGRYIKNIKNTGLIGKIASDAIGIADKSVSFWNNAISKNAWSPEINIIAQKHRGEGTTEWPYWVGLTLGNVFGFIWDEVEELLSYAKNFTFSVNKSLIDTIDELLKKIITEINSLIKLIETINQIIEFINFLFNIPTFGVLQINVGPESGGIHTSGGTAKVVELIRNSKGFFRSPQQELLDTKSIIQDHLNMQENTDIIMNPETYKSLKALNYDYIVWQNRYNIFVNIYNYIVNNNFVKQSYDLNNEEDESTILILKEELYDDFEIIKEYFNDLYPKNLDLTPIKSIDDTDDNKEQKIITYINNSYVNNIYNNFPKTFEATIDISKEYSIDNIDFILSHIEVSIKEIKRNLDILQDAYTNNEAKSKEYLDGVLTEKLGSEDANGNRTGYQDYINTVGNYFDPDEKMAFAGLVFVLGWPSFENADEYFNIDDLTKNALDEYDEWKGSFDDIIGNFSKIGSNFSKIWS